MKRLFLSLFYMLLLSTAFAQQPLEGQNKEEDKVVDYLVVFDQNPNRPNIDKAGGEQALAEAIVASINEVLKNSHIDYTFRLAGTYTMNQTVPGIVSGLNQIMWDEGVRQKRQELKADLVALVIDQPNDPDAGLSNTAAKRWDAFSSIQANTAVSHYNAAHEAGHVLGCYHARNSEHSPSRHEYAAAFISEKYMTVMNTLIDGNGAELVPIYSGPESVWNGVVLGNKRADNVRMLRETLPEAVHFGEYLDEYRYYVSEGNIVLDNQAQSHDFRVYSHSFFNLECKASWIEPIEEVDAQYMNGFYLQDGTFRFKVQPNTTGKDRTATIRIFGDDRNKEVLITIVQKAGSIDTGIRSVETAPEEEAIYSLSGLRMNLPKKELPQGIYICNGQKIIIR